MGLAAGGRVVCIRIETSGGKRQFAVIVPRKHVGFVTVVECGRLRTRMRSITYGRTGRGGTRSRSGGVPSRGIPRLAGQHTGYLARQIYDAVDGRRLPLTESHRKRFAPLVFEDVLGVTDYLARIGWNPPVITAP